MAAVVTRRRGRSSSSACWETNAPVRDDVRRDRPRRLTPWALRGGEPDWSPDGTRIVFTSNQDGPRSVSANLYTVRPDGTASRS